MTESIIKLSFCDITIIDDFIIEVKTHGDIEVGEQELKEYHQFYDQLKGPVGVLVNREEHYSYSFAALRKIAKNKNMAAAAILLAGSSNITESEYVASTVKDDLNVRVFSDRAAALNWLNSHRS